MNLAGLTKGICPVLKKEFEAFLHLELKRETEWYKYDLKLD